MQFSKEFNDNFFKNISELYIDPEIERRKQAGSLPVILHCMLCK